MSFWNMSNQSQIYQLYDQTTYNLILGPSKLLMKGLSDLGILNESNFMTIYQSSSFTQNDKFSGL